MSEAAELYERDFYAWTQEQASALRAWRPGEHRPNALDIAHIAEEIESLGASQRNAAKGLIRQIVLHFLKLRFHPDQTWRRHWQDGVDAFRLQVADVFEQNPSLRARRADLVEPVWAQALRVFRTGLERDGHDPRVVLARHPIPGAPPFDLDREVLDHDWFPGPPA